MYSISLLSLPCLTSPLFLTNKDTPGIVAILATNVRRKQYHHPSVPTSCAKAGWALSASPAHCKDFPPDFSQILSSLFNNSAHHQPSYRQATETCTHCCSFPFRPLQTIISKMCLALVESRIRNFQLTETQKKRSKPLAVCSSKSNSRTYWAAQHGLVPSKGANNPNQNRMSR